MSAARQQAAALFDAAAPATHEAENAALLAHQHAVRRWMAAPPDERPLVWRTVESAWRRVRQLGCHDRAQYAATQLARNLNKIRSTPR